MILGSDKWFLTGKIYSYLLESSYTLVTGYWYCSQDRLINNPISTWNNCFQHYLKQKNCAYLYVINRMDIFHCFFCNPSDLELKKFNDLQMFQLNQALLIKNWQISTNFKCNLKTKVKWIYLVCILYFFVAMWNDYSTKITCNMYRYIKIPCLDSLFFYFAYTNNETVK